MTLFVVIVVVCLAIIAGLLIAAAVGFSQRKSDSSSDLLSSTTSSASSDVSETGCVDNTSLEIKATPLPTMPAISTMPTMPTMPTIHKVDAKTEPYELNRRPHVLNQSLSIPFESPPNNDNNNNGGIIINKTSPVAIAIPKSSSIVPNPVLVEHKADSEVVATTITSSNSNVSSFSSDILNASVSSVSIESPQEPTFVINVPPKRSEDFSSKPTLVPSLHDWTLGTDAWIVSLQDSTTGKQFEQRMEHYWNCRNQERYTEEVSITEFTKPINDIFHSYFDESDALLKTFPLHRFLTFRDPGSVVSVPKYRQRPENQRVIPPAAILKCPRLGFFVFENLGSALSDIKSWPMVRDIVPNTIFVMQPSDWESNHMNKTEVPKTHKVATWHWKRIGVPVQDPLDGSRPFVDTNHASDGQVEIFCFNSGIDASHPRLRVIQQWAPLKNNKTATVVGTAVAGIMGASESERTGIMGACPGVCLHDMQIVHDNKTDLVSILAASERALETKSARLGLVHVGIDCPKTLPIFQDLRTRLLMNNILLTPHVARYDKHNSAFEEEEEEGDSMLLWAPGQDILTTTPHDSYSYVSGTVASSAIVTGLLARDLTRNTKHSLQDAWNCILAESKKERLENPPLLGTSDVVQSVYCML